MRKKIIQLFVAASLMSFIFVNYNAVTNTVNNSNTPLTKLFSLAFANAEIIGNCTYCGNNIDNCTCVHVDCKPGEIIRDCKRKTGESVTQSYTSSNFGVNVGVNLGISTGGTYHPSVVTEHFAWGKETVCEGNVNENGCTPVPCDA